MGGGALSSDYVSKLGSKEVIRHAELVSASQTDEVSKICHLERSERSQSNEILRLSPQNDDNFTLAPWGEGVRRTGEGSRVDGKCAFTLAEVLITLGVIGVVASLTLPSVVTNYQKKRTVNKLKSTYSILCNAIQMAKVDYGDDVNQWELPDGIDEKASSDYFSEKYLIPYLKIAKDCNPYKYRECLPVDYRKKRTFILSNGSIISVRASRELDLRVGMNLYINGYKKKMSKGRDWFQIELGGGSGNLGLDKNDLLPYGYKVGAPRTNYTAVGGTSCSKTGSKDRCFALIMYDGWKISPDYPW